MENKYYTPTIEEFHVGFEIEVLVEDVGWIKVPYMKNYLLGKGKPDIINVHNNLKEGVIRVKYLDQEDIESLGFNDFKHAASDWYKLEKRVPDGFASSGYWNCFRLCHFADENKIKIMAYEYSFNEKETTLFQGTIKNKSELKKLMFQLGINQ